MEDIDGTPMEEEKKPNDKGGSGGFVLSRWETVDPELVEAQAMTTSKWELLEQQQNTNSNSQDGDSQEEESNSMDTR